MELASTQPTGRDAWAVVGAGGVAGALAGRLRAAGKTVICAEGAVELERALADRLGASGIVFAPAEGAIQDDGPMSAERGTRALLALTRSHANQGLLTNCRLYVTTQNLHAVLPSDSVRLTDAGISGLAATIANEFAELRCTRIDVDPTDASEAAEEIAREALADTPESWVAWRKGRRFAARLQRADCAAEMGEGRVRLASDRGLDGLQWRPEEPRALNPHEVEIEVRAAPLNFHDVASVVGLISDRSDLGGECAGVVTRVGPLTKRFRPGDAVVAMTPGSFATFAIAPDERVIPKPEGLSFESASAQGLVYLTAEYSLNTVARMQRGERVLIHAAAGGVGYAAVQLCMRAGVEVFATAGSEAKRAFLRELGVQHVFSSRTLDFAADIERITEGRGVDVILDCLAGAFIDAGLSLLRPGGRFVEIGKTDIRDPIAVAAARPGVVYTAVDLADRLRDEPEAMMRRLSALLESMAAGELHPAPHRTYDFRDAKAAFHDLAAARNIGKLVLAPRPAQPLVREDGAYIVTGGASGLGFVVAEWLAGQGAARILLFGRRPPASEVAARIAEWRKRGVDIAAHQGDVGQSDAVAALIAEAGAALRGVVHCANVLDDAPAGELTWERFATVLHAKAQGAWNLHRATIDLPLDFFVLFSSFASLAGTRGGANYAAANIALDSLAHLRRRQNLPALSLDWGVWGDVGWATRRPAGAVVTPGFRPMSSAQGILAMEFALRNVRSPQVAIAPIDWPHLIGAMGHNVAPLWSDFATERSVVQGGESKTAEPGLAAAIADTSPEAAHASVLERLQRMAAVALGIDDPARIDPDRPLQDLGLDSILAIELRNTLAYSLGRPVPATVLFDHPTLLGLTDYCLSAIATELRQSAPSERHDDCEDLLALIESLSDEDVHARLLSRGFETAV
jgi:NADPH:quinone reductase-like Zn-dependent oxidoreductase/acyl carrier protein